MTIGEIIAAECASAVYVCISCTWSSRLEHNSQFVGPGNWGVRGSERKKNLAISRWITVMGSVCRMSYKWEVGVTC